MNKLIHILTISIGIFIQSSIYNYFNVSYPKDINNTLSTTILNNASKDTLIYFNDSDFINLDLIFDEISSHQYKDILTTSIINCSLDSTGFILEKGLTLNYNCREICELHLVDKQKNNKLVLPSNYDQGIIDLNISPSCKNFIIYSSYDGNDYAEYHNYRAEIYGFSLTDLKGVQAIKPVFKFYTKDWSIEKIIWINDYEIALKTYQENRSIKNQDSLQYNYLTATIIK